MQGDFSDRELTELGYVPGIPGMVRGPFDKRKNYRPIENQPEDIWEDKDGIRARYQPQTLLLSEPLLVDPYTDWSLGHREMSRLDIEEQSNFWIEVVLELSHALNRKIFPEKDDGS